MTDKPEKTLREKVIDAHAEHPEWTARQIAGHLGVERYHVYNNARAAGLTLAPAPLPAGAVEKAALPTPDEAAAVPAVVSEPVAPPAEFTVFANNPADMVEAQQAMVAWCDEKIAAAAVEQHEAVTNATAASESRFWTSEAAWNRQVKKIGDRIDFYEKVKAALEAGYYIVPPFPIDMFAIRTTAKKPRGGWKTQWWTSSHTQKEQMLPAGDGRYVSPDPLVGSDTFQEDDGKGSTKPVRRYRAEYFEEAAFPFTLARGEVLSATRAALALKVFDRIGALPASQRHADPIVCGQILMPHRNREPLTFFVTWWLDTKTL